MVERVDFVQDRYADTDEWRAVQGVADALVADLERTEVATRIVEANQPGNSSGLVQAVFLAEAAALGFRDESEGLFAAYESALRPDYFLPLEKTGIILEVERGKTTINNMDLLDFWKCHICEHADHLFLMVPRELRQNPTMSPRREFASVKRRLATFFEAGNETNVRSCVLLGY